MLLRLDEETSAPISTMHIEKGIKLFILEFNARLIRPKPN